MKQTLMAYAESMRPKLDDTLHPKTVMEIFRAIRVIIEWRNCDISADDVTPELLKQFGATLPGKRYRGKQLASNLRTLMRIRDPEQFPLQVQRSLYKGGSGFEPQAVCVASKPPKKMLGFVDWYLANRNVSANHGKTLRHRASAYVKFVGDGTLRTIFTEPIVNAFLAALDSSGSPHTVNKWRQDLLTIWSAAAFHGLANEPRRRLVNRIKCPSLDIECFTIDEVRELLEAAGKLPGILASGCRRSTYWQAIIRAAWETGLRRGDLWRLTSKQIRSDGSFIVVQHKTGKQVPYRLTAKTLESLELAGGSLQWPLDEKTFSDQFTALVKASGACRGSFKWLRRASGSYVEMVQPGAGHKQLGNTEQIFRQHYDSRLGGATWTMPPTL